MQRIPTRHFDGTLYFRDDTHNNLFQHLGPPNVTALGGSCSSRMVSTRSRPERNGSWFCNSTHYRRHYNSVARHRWKFWIYKFFFYFFMFLRYNSDNVWLILGIFVLIKSCHHFQLCLLMAVVISIKRRVNSPSSQHFEQHTPRAWRRLRYKFVIQNGSIFGWLFPSPRFTRPRTI